MRGNPRAKRGENVYKQNRQNNLGSGCNDDHCNLIRSNIKMKKEKTGCSKFFAMEKEIEDRVDEEIFKECKKEENEKSKL